jgi:hypothetical protein
MRARAHTRTRTSRRHTFRVARQRSEKRPSGVSSAPQASAPSSGVGPGRAYFSAGARPAPAAGTPPLLRASSLAPEGRSRATRATRGQSATPPARRRAAEWGGGAAPNTYARVDATHARLVIRARHDAHACREARVRESRALARRRARTRAGKRACASRVRWHAGGRACPRAARTRPTSAAAGVVRSEVPGSASRLTPASAPRRRAGDTLAASLSIRTGA